jgi:hypothetical protein
VTLAEIYVAQGHTDRALAVLAEVLANEPDHAAALALRERIERRGEPHRVPTPVRSAPEADDITPGRPISVTAPEVPAKVDASAADDEPTPNPFPDEPSPITSEHAPYPQPVRHSEPALYVEEQTVRGVMNLFPDRPACALITSSGAVEAFYELPVSAAGAVLRLVWFTPGASGVERGMRDLPVEPGYHRVPVEGLSNGAEVRAALGVLEPEGFAPLAVAWVYERAAGAPALAFAPPGEEPPTLRARVEARVVALG